MSEENRPEGELPKDDKASKRGKKAKDARANNGKKSTKDRNGTPLCNGKSKRTGLPCKQFAMANGKCRMHGGKSTGPSMAGRIALSEQKVVTGERQRIYFNYLREDEKIENRIPYDAKMIVEDEIFLIEIRQKRIMERIHNLEVMRMEDPEFKVIRESKKSGKEMLEVDAETGMPSWRPAYEMKDVQHELIHRARHATLTELEESLTRVTALKGKMIELREKIESKTINEDDGSLGMLTKIIGDARNRYDGPRNGAKVVEGEFTEVKS